MCCDDLVCARCTRPVSQGHCPVCRSARAEFHGPLYLGSGTLGAVLVALLLVVVYLAWRAG